jgi:hypothetical protein
MPRFCDPFSGEPEFSVCYDFTYILEVYRKANS